VTSSAGARVGSLAIAAALAAARRLRNPLLNGSLFVFSLFLSFIFTAWYGSRGSGLLALVVAAVAAVFVLRVLRLSDGPDRISHHPDALLSRQSRVYGNV